MEKKLHKRIALLTAITLVSFATTAQETNKNIKLKKTDDFGQTSFLSFNETDSLVTLRSLISSRRAEFSDLV